MILASARDPMDLEERGYSLLNDGMFQEAADTFAAVLTTDSDARGGHVGSAWAFEAMWDWRKAIGHWSRCAEVGSAADAKYSLARTGYCLLQVGQVEQARAALALAGDEFIVFETLARIAEYQGGPQEAREAWQTCTSQFPDVPAGFIGHALFLFSRADYDFADELLAHVVEVWPESAEAAVLFAKCAVSAKRFDDAEQRWSAVIAAHPRAREANLGYIRYLVAINDETRIAAYLVAMEASSLRYAECLLEYHLAHDDLGQAADQARHVARLERQKPWHRTTLVGILMRHGGPDQLKEALKISVDLHLAAPESVAVKCQLAEALIRSDRRTDAETVIQSLPPGDRRVDVEILRAWLAGTKEEAGVSRRLWDGILERRYFPAVHSPIYVLDRVDTGSAEPRKGDILLFSAFRNEAPRIEWFLRHYRSLGVDKFFIVDNGSTDDTAELLTAAPGRRSVSHDGQLRNVWRRNALGQRTDRPSRPRPLVHLC